MPKTHKQEIAELSLSIIEDYIKKGRKTIKLSELGLEVYRANKKPNTLKAIDKIFYQPTFNELDKDDFAYNLDHQTRDKLIFGENYAQLTKIFTSINYFADLSIERLQELIDLKFADPKERQNEAPTNLQMLNFGKKITEKYENISIRYHGYAVSPQREDYRISIEAIEIIISDEFNPELRQQLKKDFTKFAKLADTKTFNGTSFYAWWD